MNVLHINHADHGGGAEIFALDLLNARPDDHMLVGRKLSDIERITELPYTRIEGLLRLADRLIFKMGHHTALRQHLGLQDRGHDTMKMIKESGRLEGVDIIHLHNIHGSFFDLSAIKELAGIRPIVWSAHDLWPATGGEGGIPIGATEKERRNTYPLSGGFIDHRKKALNQKKKLFVELKEQITFIAPSMHHLSALKTVHTQSRIEYTPLGVDVELFHPADADRLRGALPNVLVYSTSSVFKDTARVCKGLQELRSPYRLHILGDPIENIDERVQVVNHGKVNDRHEFAELLRRMDIAVFASRAESFGLLPAECAASGALVLLNEDLDVFKEHQHIYGAELYSSTSDLTSRLQAALDDLSHTRQLGQDSAARIVSDFNRRDTIASFESLYERLAV